MNRSLSWTRTISGNDRNSSFSLPSLELNSLWDQLRQSQTLCCQQARCKKAQFLSSNFLFSWLYNSTFVKTFFNSISSVQSFLLPNNNQHNLKSHSKRLLLPNLLLFIVIIYPDSHLSDEDFLCHSNNSLFEYFVYEFCAISPIAQS